MGETIRGTDARKWTPYLLDGQQILIIDRENNMLTDAISWDYWEYQILFVGNIFLNYILKKECFEFKFGLTFREVIQPWEA